ncbi:MarR family winged helix-turn-helix transcriptional regulator [Neobacillus niacini]|uniref:MarR family winged helix-turn-helix transcriptional regulator n=1 Tax=Neobacillus niacini TaxID=86668 RepID=UPI00203F1A88|nr:MarR family transcriptional regulator [Neobacillus niacini]MCM3691301.1 MarR family transcriptional regulator [Neobacillus niacini]
MENKCTNQPFLLLMQTSKSIQEIIREEMTKNKLSLTEFAVLEVLFQQGKQNIQQIGNKILISSGSMTYVIDKLEKRGLLSRNDCPEDRRIIHVTLTKDGIQLMNEIMPKHQELVDDIFSSLRGDEVETIITLLKKVKSKIDA